MLPRLAEAEAVLVGDECSMSFGNPSSTVIEKVASDFNDTSAFALQVSTAHIFGSYIGKEVGLQLF